MSCSTEQDVQRMGSRMGVEHAESQSAEYCQRECRPNAKSPAKNGSFPGRKLKLQVQTELPDRVFTKDKLPGEGRTIISVALIDANTGDTVTAGWESSAKVEVVVLNDEFKKDKEDNWSPEEFERHVVQGRKGPLLKGDLPVRLKEGVAELRGLSLNENSSKMRNGKFRIGVRVASGYRGNTQIQEGVTGAIRVLERRGKGYRKHYPPLLEDEVWRLEKIAKDGTRRQKLKNVEIYKVKDFLLQLSIDPEKLKEILGMEKCDEEWEILEDHAQTCKTDWRLYFYKADGQGERGAIFDSEYRLIGLIKSRVFVATHLLSDPEKVHGAEIVQQALAYWNDVWVLHGKAFSGSMQKNSSSSSSSHALDGFAPGIRAARVDQEPPPANAGSAVAGRNDMVDLPLLVPSQNTNCGDAMGYPIDESGLAASHHISSNRRNCQISQADDVITSFGPPIYSPYIIQQEAMRSQMDPTVEELLFLAERPCAPRPEGDHVMEDAQFNDADDPMNYLD